MRNTSSSPDLPGGEKKRYLFLIKNVSQSQNKESVSRVNELGLRVLARYGQVALEVLATSEQAERAFSTGLFEAYTKGPISTEHKEKTKSKEEQFIIDLWNSRFTSSYKRIAKDVANRGKSWGSEGLDEPLPYSAINLEDFFEFVKKYQKEKGQTIIEEISHKDLRARTKQTKLTGREFQKYELKLFETYKDRKLAYHLSRLAVQLGPKYYTVLLKLPKDFLIDLLTFFFAEPSCWRMRGENSVGIVFVESNQDGGPKFSDAERNDICDEILDGLAWLAEEQPYGNLTWVFDFQFIKINVANGDNDSNESYWRDPAMGQVSYNGHTYTAGWAGVAEYREDMRLTNLSRHGIVIFVTPYGNSWHAYAGGGRVTLAKRNNWGGWGINTIDTITAHEVGHLYGSADEYTGSGTPCASCDTTHGCDNIPNGNCGACASPHQDCMMDANSKRICEYTKGHIGWSDIFVETTTADVLWAGTDDDVWLDIGDFTYVLDTPNHNDRERNNVEGYAIADAARTSSDIKRIMIRKSADGFAGGWKLEGIRVWFRGNLICNNNSINKWLEDDDRTWIGCISNEDLISTLTVKITTADVLWAGTDDDVSITLAGRTWNLDNAWHNDFERGNTDTFTLDPGTGLYLSSIHSVKIHKSPDGFAGGWKLKGVQVIANGVTIYNNQSINKWLEDDDRDWTGNL